MEIAAQLYTVAKLMREDFASAVKHVAQLGYRNVELAGYGNLKTAAEVRAALDAERLRAAAGHWDIEHLESGLDTVIADARTLGVDFIVCPWMPESRRSADGWAQFARQLDTIGARVRAAGLQFGYHNHSFEFEMFAGKSAMDIVFDNTDPANVRVELDVYWLAHGNQDPVAFLERHGKRASLLHLKDMEAGPEQRFAPVGSGKLDFKAILAAAGRAGVKWGVVEEDQSYERSAMDDLGRSLRYLESIGAA